MNEDKISNFIIIGYVILILVILGINYLCSLKELDPMTFGLGFVVFLTFGWKFVKERFFDNPIFDIMLSEIRDDKRNLMKSLAALVFYSMTLFPLLVYLEGLF